MIPDKFAFLRTPLFAIVWFVPIAFLLLLRESPQLFAGVGFVVGLLLGLYGIGALFLLWRRPYLRSASPLDLGLLLMFTALVISAVFSIDPSRSWRLVWNWGACMVAFYVALTLLRAGGSVQQLIKVLLTVISILVIAGYQQLFAWLWRWYDVFGTSLRPMVSLIPRVHGVTGSANILAFFIVVGIALALTYRTADTHKWPWVARLWIILALPLFFVTRSRSSLIALAAAMAIIALGYLWIRLRGRLSVQMITRVGSGLLVLGVVTIGLIFLLRPATSLGERNVSYRLQLWQFGFQNWLDYPVTGSGADTFATTILLRDETVPPAFPLHAAHNWWINILSDDGLVGIAAVVLCWILLLRFLWKYQSYEHWTMTKLGLLGALGAFCVHSFLDTPEHWVIFTAALLLASLFVSLEPLIQEDNALKKTLFLWWVPVWIGLLWFGYQAFQAVQIYEAGVAAAAENDWETAARLFNEAQQEALYPETSFQLAAATANAILAQADEQYLLPAITAYENVIATEPGWPTNYANLAALYWQNGQPETAVMTMESAVILAPQIPLYHLNLALWHLELGDEAAARPIFQQLYQQRDAWRAAPLWQEDTVASAAAASLNDEELPVAPVLAKRMDNPAGWLALAQGNEAAAKQQFDQQIIDNPYDGTAYLGLSIISYQQNDLEQAKTSVEQADLLGTKDAFWRNIIIEEMAFDELLSSYAAYSTFDISNARSTTYSRTVLLRSGLVVDVIPQLFCFSATPVLSQNLAVLSPHLSLEEQADLESFLQGDRDGVRPCVTVKR